MNHRKIIFAAVIGVLVPLSTVSAQSSRPGPPAEASAKPGTLAVVNDQPITLDDLDPKVRALVEGLDREIAEARRNALKEQVQRFLYEAEAKKRKVTVEQMLETEIYNRVADPTDEEIRAIYEANRSQIGTAGIETVRPKIIAYLRGQQTQKLTDELLTRLRASTPVVMATDANAPNLAPTTVLATVGGRAITAAMLNERSKPAIYDLRLKAYDAQKSAVDSMIYDLLIIAEAKRRNIKPEEIIRTEITDKIRTPTDADVLKFYEENKAHLEGDLDSWRAGIANHLLQQSEEQLKAALDKRLRAQASVRVLLTEPEPPVQAISADDDPSRGDAQAPVTVIEFTDFQCPACAKMHPLIEEVLKSYGNRVRFVVRDFPLAQHPQARKAAEAANAAHAQGKFFEYMALLFKNQAALDVPSLKKYATELGLDRARFDAALEGGAYAAEVSHDIAEGQQYGVNSTPTIFVNGVRVVLRELTAEPIRAAIERALAQTARPPARAK